MIYLLDFSKTFARVLHKILIGKLVKSGLNRMAIQGIGMQNNFVKEDSLKNNSMKVN